MAADTQAMPDNRESAGHGWSALCRIGGIVAWIFLAYSLATMVQLIVLGGPPASAIEAFALLQKNKTVGLLRLDLPTMFAMPLYYFLFLGLYAALRRADAALALLASSLAFAGVTLVLATPTALSLLTLSEKHAAATTEAARVQLEAAGEAILASDLWHGTGAVVGGILLQAGGVVICAVMLRSRVFGKAIAYLGIVTYGLDLAHIALRFLLPFAGFVLMALAGPLYLVWFFLVARRLSQIAAEGAAS